MDMSEEEFIEIYEAAERVIMNPESSMEELQDALASVEATGNIDAWQTLQFQVGELASPGHLGGGFYVWMREAPPKAGKLRAMLEKRKK